MIEKVAGRYDVAAAVKAKAKNSYAGGVSSGSDEVNFSSFAVELARVSGELRSIPEMRQDIIDDLKKKVEAGEYRPPLEKIAHKLFLAGILDSEE